MTYIECLARRAFVRRAVVAMLLLILSAVAANARAATIVSETTWGGPVSEVTNGVAVGSDGATYLTGFTTSFDQFGQFQLFVVKHAADGTILWQRTWAGPEQFGSAEGTDIAVAADGSVYVTGSTQGNRGDALLLKFAADGTLLWQKRWDGGATERGEALAVAPDGSVYVVGGTSSFGGTHLFLLRFDPDGTLLSQQGWGEASGDGVAVAPDGSVYVAGTAVRPGGEFAFDVVLLKFDAAGALVWQRAYSASEIADARGGVAVAPDGSVYVGGTTQESTQKVVVDALVVKFGGDGSLLWDRGWGGRSGDTGEGVAALPNGDAVLVGSTNSFGAGSDDAFILRLSSATGRGLDSNTWGGTEIDNGNDAVVAPDGSLIVGATTQTPSPHVFARASSRAYRVRGTVAPATGALVGAAGTVADPTGTVGTPTGTSPGSGGIDAAVLRIAP